MIFITTAVAQVAHNPEFNYDYDRSHSLYAPYTELELNSNYWDFGQDAVIFTQSGVRLTPDMQSRRGWLWSKTQISGSFEMDMEFKIHGKNTGLAGDGMALWFVEDKFTNGEAIGFKSSWNGIGVILDTYNNGRNGDLFRPHYVQAVYNDKTKYYNKDTDGVEMSIGGCPRGLRNKEKSTRLRVVYIENKKFQVFLNEDSWADWKLCFEKDLSDIKMPKELHFGFTAETGGLTDNHDVVGINTNKITPKVNFTYLVWCPIS
eukprot:NODE_53_length_26956_cov_0.387348.p10 type:complete len:261 gc:universal NODE_53_length_26956_cov_0.387348:6436-7218(+)